jgi:hypothetical protein
MWTSVVALALLTSNAGQPGKLAVTNERLTYGHLGPERKEAKYLPGDVIHLMFEVDGIAFDTNGKATYATGLEILDGQGTELLKQKPRTASAQNYLGGNTLPCAAHLQIPLESKPGFYTFRVNVVDGATKKVAVVERKIEVLPKQFGLILVGTSADREGAIAWSPVGVVGDSIFLNFSAVGFTRNATTKQPHLKVVMRVLDEKGNAVKGAKMQGEANSDVPADLQSVPMQFTLTLNRAGRFTLELTATDMLANKSVTVQFPVRVVTP